MNKAARSLVTLVVALALQGCIIFPAPGKRTDAGVAPRQVTPNITTRAKLLKKAGDPDVRAPDERFFLYQNTGSREWGLCVWFPPLEPLLDDVGGCARAGTNRWARWVLIEFDENGVVKKEIIKDCKDQLCGSPQAAFLAVLEERYSPSLATEYRRALEQADALSQAVRDGDVQAVKALLEAGANANARGAEDRTALHLAVSSGNRALAERLLAGGADVNAEDKNHATPLLLVSQDDSEMIALLRAHGAAEVNHEHRRMLRGIVGAWHGDGLKSGRRIMVEYVLEENGAFVFDWIEPFGARRSGHEEQPPGTLHVNGEKFEYRDADGLVWTLTLDKDKTGRHILQVRSKEGTWTLKRTPCRKGRVDCISRLQ